MHNFQRNLYEHCTEGSDWSGCLVLGHSVFKNMSFEDEMARCWSV